MPQQIEIPGQGILEFPDEFSDDQIKDVIKRKFPPTVPDPRLQQDVEAPPSLLPVTSRPVNVAEPIGSPLQYHAMDKAPSPFPTGPTSTGREFLREFTGPPPEMQQRAQEMTERAQNLINTLGREGYDARLRAITDRFDAAIKSVEGDGEEPATRRQKLSDMRDAALEEMGVDTLRPNQLPRLSKGGAATLVGPEHPRLASALSTAQNVVAGTAEGMAAGPGPYMMTAGAGHVVGKAMLAQMMVDIPKDFTQSVIAYAKGDVEEGDRLLIQAGGTAALMGLPAAAAKIDSIRADAINTRNKVVDPRDRAWAYTFGAGGPAHETEMVRTSQKVLEPHEPETTLLREVRPTPPVEPGDLKPIPEPGESEQDYATRIGREQQHRGAAPRETVQTDDAQVREEGGAQPSDSGGTERGAPGAEQAPTETAPVGDENLASETTDNIVKRTTVGKERNEALAERANAAERLAATLKPGDTLVDSDGTRHVVDQVFKDGTVFTKTGAEVTVGSVLIDGGKIERGQETLPPVPSGNQIIQVRRPDGSTYTALFAGYEDTPDFPPSHKRMQIGRLVSGKWSHGYLRPDEEVVDSAENIPSFEEWKAQQAPSDEPSFQPPANPGMPRGLPTEQRRAAFEKWRQESGEWAKKLQAWEAAQPQGKPIIFESENMVHAITPNIGGGWRTTAFVKSDQMAWGHEVFKTRYEAVRDRVMHGDKRIEKIPFEVQPLKPDIEEGTARTSTVPSGDAPPSEPTMEVGKATSLTAEPGATPGGTVPPSIPETSSLIERAMNLVRTRKLGWDEKSALGREMENARRGEPEEFWKLIQNLEHFAEYQPGKEPKEEKPPKPEPPKGGLSERDPFLLRVSQIGKLPAFFPPGWMMSAYTRLIRKQRGGGILSPKEREQFNSLMENFPQNFEDDYGVGGEAMRAAYDAAKEAGIAGELFDVKKSGRNLRLDTILDTLKRETGREWKGRDLFDEIKRLSQEHLSRGTEGAGSEEALNKEAERQVKEKESFTRDTQKSSEGTEPISQEELHVGSSFTLKGTKLRVTEIFTDEDGRVTNVTLEDGNKYGTQYVEGGITLRMDEGSLKHPKGAETTTDFLPPEGEAEPTAPVEAPKLRTGEKSGELFQGEDQPFNLSGEKGTDAERLAREKAEADRKAAEKKAFDESHAQELPKSEEKPQQFYGPATAPWPHGLVAKNPSGEGWRFTWFTEFYEDPGKLEPKGHKDFATRQEAIDYAKSEDFREAQTTLPEKTEAPTQAPKPEEGKAPDGTHIRNFVKENGRWWSIKPDGTKNKLPANIPTSRRLEAEANLPPAPPETRTSEQILSQAKRVRVKLPEGATVLRAYNSKGQKADVFIAEINRGDNNFRGEDWVRLEAGVWDKNRNFKKVDGPVTVEEVKTDIIDKAIEKLQNAKIKKKGKGGGDARTFLPLFGPTISLENAIRAWNDAMDIGSELLQKGRPIVEAIEAALQHMREAAARLGGTFNEAMARARLKQVLEPGPTGALVRTPEELAKQRAFGGKPAVRTTAAYSDIVRLKDEQAQALNLSPRARRLLSLPNQMELVARTGHEAAGIENYQEARAAVERATPDIKWSVIRDALHSLGFEQRRTLKLKAMYEKQRDLVTSEGFQKKLARLSERQWESETRTDKERTFRNVLSVKAAEFIAELERSKVEDARTQQLRDDLRQARQLQNFALAVGVEMDNIVSTVYPNYWEFGRSGKNGQAFTDLYLAMKNRQGEPVTDPQRLALVRLAAEVLAINDSLSTRLYWQEAMRREPDLAQSVRDFGRAFSERMQADPAKAIKELVTREGKHATMAERARSAFQSLNRDMMRELENMDDLESAYAVDQRVKATDQWKDLVNQVYGDANALRIPDAIMKDHQKGDVFNEFTGQFQRLDPFGSIHTVDLNWTRDNVARAQTKIQGFLDRINDWLNDPANANDPDRPYWQNQHEFVDAVYNTAAVLNPGSVKSIIFRSSWTMPEFFFRQAAIPAAKVAQTAFENWHRAWLQGTQWSSATEQPLIRSLYRAAKKHGFNPTLGFQEYREQILNPLAWEYRHGRAVKAGDVLFGHRIESEDITAMKQMGRAINEIFNKQKNLGAERVMEPGWLYDEWARGVFSIRKPQEFAAESGMTLPHEPSQAAKTLSARVMEDVGIKNLRGLTDLFNSDLYFDSFVKRWLGQRSPDFSKVSPFEPLFKQIVEMWNRNDPDAPRSVEEIVDFIDRSSDENWNQETILAHLVGSMADELGSFYNQIVKKDPNDFSDIRVVRATKDGPFTTGFKRDLGSSFYYDFGMVNAQEVRAMAIDSGMYHMTRFANALASLEQEYSRALRDLAEAKGRPELLQRLRQTNKALWRSGGDFRDFDRLMGQLNEVKYFRTRLPIFSGRDVMVYEGLKNVYRLIGNSVLRTLSGWATMARVLTGSVAKQGFVFGAAERWYALGFPKAAWSMVLSTLKIGVGGPAMVVGRRLGLVDRFKEDLSGLTEEIFRNGKYFNQQYAFGLGTKTPVLDTMWNNLTMPYTHGRGYDPRLSENAGLRLIQKGAYRSLSVLENLLEPIRVIFPTLGYSIAYDSVARQMYWRIKAMESQARRTFDQMTKTGEISRFDLTNPKNVSNVLHPDYVLPSNGILPKTATQLNLIREMFKRGTDIDLQDAVFTFWKRLAESPTEQHKDIHLLSADARPEDAARIETNRAGALASVGLFDIHHASPANRMWALRAGAVGRIMFPIAGWTVQSTRQWFAILGRAAHDPNLRPAVLTAMTGVTVLAALGMLGLSGDMEKRIFEQLKWILDKKVDPVRHFGQGRNAKENVQIAISDMTAYITTVANMFDAVLGEQSNRASTIENVYPTEKIKSLLNYVNGVVHTHDPTYGLASFASRELPILRPIINRLPGQEGIVAEQNIRTIIQRFAPPELLRQTQGSYGTATPTELSPIKQKLANAIYKKDWIGVIEAYDEFKRKAIQLGREEPERLAANVMRSLNPYSMALIGHPTDAQRQTILDRLPPDQRQMLLDAETAYLAAAQSVGVQSQMIKKEPGDRVERAAAPAGGGGVSVGGLSAPRLPAGGGGGAGVSRRISMGRLGGRIGSGRGSGIRTSSYGTRRLRLGSRASSGSRYARSLGGRTRNISLRRPRTRRVRRVRLRA